MNNNTSTRTIRVGIIQSSPVYWNLEASVEKAIELIARAANQGARIVAFGETWLPGYPAWLDYCPNTGLWNYEPTKEVFAELRRNSLVVPSKESTKLGQAAKEIGVAVVIGVNERVRSGPGQGTLIANWSRLIRSGLFGGRAMLLV
jgi:predicted amidohydrolase